MTDQQYRTCPEHGLLKPCLHCEPSESKYEDAKTLPPIPQALPEMFTLCTAALRYDKIVKCDICGNYKSWFRDHGEI